MSGDDRPRDARLGKSVPPCLADILPCFEFYLLGPYSWACIRLLSTSFFEYIRQLRPELDLVRIGGKYGFNIAQCVQIDETFTILRMRIGHPSHSRLDRIDMMPPPPERPRLGDALEQRQVEVAMMATAPTPPPERLRLGDALEQRQVAMATAPIVWTVPPPKIQVEIYTTVVMSYRYRDYQLSAEALNYVLRTFEALGFRPCGPVVHHAHPRDNNTVQRDYESIVRLAHQDDARNVSSACNLGIWDYGHVKVPQEDTTVFVRTSRGRWRRRRRLLKHASAG